MIELSYLISIFIGFNIPVITTANGIRASTAEAFIKPNLKRRNFHILTKAFVTEVKIH